mmetsp:Transcript_5127/g.15341  ORF Transcript_5127/g.15341 Transcript_5127/m.15341 type:complete len:688 (-) Transcript_5127:1761-3824(-)
MRQLQPNPLRTRANGSSASGWSTKQLDLAARYRDVVRRMKLLWRRSGGSPVNTKSVGLVLLLVTIVLVDVFARQYGPETMSRDMVPGQKDLGSLKEGTSIVAACQGRENTLPTVMRTWMAADNVDEIVLVDWSSEKPVSSILRALSGVDKVRIYRVEKAGNWSLSRAYNLAVHLATRKNIVRLDCDHALKPNFVRTHPIANDDRDFYAGNWSIARNSNELHLTGALVISQKNFWAVSGYDERIQSYGAEDINLCDRLVIAGGLVRHNVDYDAMIHLPHKTADERTFFFRPVDIDTNRILVNTLPQWPASNADRSYYKVEEPFLLVPSWTPKGLRQLMSQASVQAARELALDVRLHSDFHVPYAFLKAMPAAEKEKLVLNLIRKRSNRGEGAGKPTVMFAHAMHGLGNRIRALGSAMAVAKNTGRVLVVIWEKDRHCEASFSDLFSNDFPVIEKMIAEAPFTPFREKDGAWNYVNVYNYMELEPGAKKNELVTASPGKHVYYKGAYIMSAGKLSSWNGDNAELQKLVPSDDVQTIIDRMEDIDFKRVVSVHIRNRGLDTDIEGVDSKKEYTKDGAKTMDFWRSKSNYKNFVAKMKEILRESPDTLFYLSSDTVEVLQVMKNLFPGRVYVTERTCDSRSGDCAKYALADLYLLSKGRVVLGSNWSSFTEAAQRLGGLKGMLSGRDFAKD